ncbi:hypothetical protein ARALYDRAFT_901832 [Arabidopsis lyrata subsp. lyrata]|uniref:DUF1985 domain-containing protein n=1 Tax=Arabidopsis lyrata subsp. lyrata TaxID=81972 RepID=D7LK86_ARALL|nr:hypothetical protein ARALYDRAFT_901832 [Arabidopsis lyrata subsp. lyrata]
MANLALPHRMFCTSVEPDDNRKINIYFVLKYLGTVKEDLKKPVEKFHKCQAMWILVLRTVNMKRKKNELWFVANGFLSMLFYVPITMYAIIDRNKSRKISKLHVQLVSDVKKFLDYPWGREAFSLAMRSICVCLICIDNTKI